MDSRGDTIAAVATAPGRAGVAVVRVSGPDAFAVGERVARRRPQPGRVLFARFAFDSGLLLAFAAPRSYTGEDVVEFQCHGGAVAPRRVLEACLAAGARLARRGEFTERAFLNGKISYEEAEGVIDLIDAKTDRAAAAALEPGPLRSLYSQALEVSSSVEHALDFEEGELPPEFFSSLGESLAALRDALRDARRRMRERKILRDGALVVLAGKPNAGKSSLMNALLGEDRAIVSATPGTTRDSIEEWLDVGGWPVRLVDTAGLRESGDAIEAEGVRRSEALAAKADLVLILEPGEPGGGKSGESASAVFCSPVSVLHGSPASKTLLVSSKCDVARGPGINVSSVTGEGLDELRAAIAGRLAALADSPDRAGGEDIAARRLAAVVESEAELGKTCAGTSSQSSPDLVLLANVLRSVCETLGAECGAAYSEDVLDRLFSRFCVGK